MSISIVGSIMSACLCVAARQCMAPVCIFTTVSVGICKSWHKHHKLQELYLATQQQSSGEERMLQGTTMQLRRYWWRRQIPTSATPSPGRQCSLLRPMGTLRRCCAWCSMGPPGATRLTVMSSRPCAASPPSSENAFTHCCCCTGVRGGKTLVRNR